MGSCKSFILYSNSRVKDVTIQFLMHFGKLFIIDIDSCTYKRKSPNSKIKFYPSIKNSILNLRRPETLKKLGQSDRDLKKYQETSESPDETPKSTYLKIRKDEKIKAKLISKLLKTKEIEKNNKKGIQNVLKPRLSRSTFRLLHYLIFC